MQVGIRELKNRLSEYVGHVKSGVEVTVTEHGRPVAVLRAVEPRPSAAAIARWAAEGTVVWKGGKPCGSARPPRVAGSRASAAVLEGRR